MIFNDYALFSMIASQHPADNSVFVSVNIL